jgi:hypothetical protein
MALTIAPAVSGTRDRFIREGTIFFAGVVVGGCVALAGALILMGIVTAIGGSGAAHMVAAALICWAILGDLGLRIWMPYRRGQVPESFRSSLPRMATAAAFGFLLGLGFATFFTYSVHTAMLLALPFTQQAPLAFGCLCLFAAGKCMPLIASIGAEDTDQIGSRFIWWRTGMQTMRLTTAAASAACVLLVFAGRVG